MSQPARQLVEHFFRHESANLIAVLSRAFGVSRIDLVEDMVQAAMLEAMNAWKQKSTPDNPAAWIHRVAKNRVLDALRREQIHQRAMAFAGQQPSATEALVDQWLESDQLPDSLLRMIFVCCHPELDRQSQIALTLKILCGFSVGEIARGLLMKSAAVKKRIQRAKKKLAELQLPIDLPAPNELQERMGSVHDVLYLMFNEGYSTSRGVDPIRDDLCEEAARLCHLLCEHHLATPSTRALLALMLFHAARLDSRIDEDGVVVLLEDQDRSQWDRRLIQVAEFWLAQSGERPVTRFHLEAAIALLHCRASSVSATDWPAIIQLYDQLLRLRESPVYKLNRAIAIAQSGDIGTATMELEHIRASGRLSNYFLLECAQARLYELSNAPSQAIDCYQAALDHDLAEHERALLKRKINELRRLHDS